MDISKALERVKSVNLKGGLVGKTTSLLVVLSVCVSAVCIATKVWWIALVLILPLMGMVFYSLKRCFDFAEKHPQAAIMEGSEFLVHERIMFAQKDRSSDPLLETTINDYPPQMLPQDDVKEPDPPPAVSLPENTDETKESE